MTDVEKFLQELAVTDWNKFVQITGLDTLQVSICQQRKKGKSIRQIARKTGMPPASIQSRCKKCME